MHREAYDTQVHSASGPIGALVLKFWPDRLVLIWRDDRRIREATNRLRRELNLLLQAGYSPLAFYTVTLPSDWERFKASWLKTKRAFINALDAAVRRRKLTVLWVEEFQERGAPHFHLVVWGQGDRDLSGFQAYLEGLAGRVLGSQGVDHRRPKGNLIPYLTKKDQKLPPPDLDRGKRGRWWGILGRPRDLKENRPQDPSPFAPRSRPRPRPQGEPSVYEVSSEDFLPFLDALLVRQEEMARALAPKPLEHLLNPLTGAPSYLAIKGAEIQDLEALREIFLEALEIAIFWAPHQRADNATLASPSPWGVLLSQIPQIVDRLEASEASTVAVEVDGEVVLRRARPSRADLEAHSRFPGMPPITAEDWLRGYLERLEKDFPKARRVVVYAWRTPIAVASGEIYLTKAPHHNGQTTREATEEEGELLPF